MELIKEEVKEKFLVRINTLHFKCGECNQIHVENIVTIKFNNLLFLMACWLLLGVIITNIVG